MDRKSQLLRSFSRDEPLRADKRAGRRSTLRVPIVAKWGVNHEYEVKGVTRDLYDKGVFFHAEADLPLGADVELSFTVSRPFTEPESFHFIGTVVRIEPSGNSAKGFAVQVSKSELLSQQSESPIQIPALPTRKASWFGFDVPPWQIELRQKEGPEAQHHPPSPPPPIASPSYYWSGNRAGAISSVP